jgi:O-succinylbenzoic acid--CoA ligase
VEPWLTERASRTPGAIAIETTDVEVTFGALAERVESVARRLVACGATPGARVAVLGEPTVRSLEIVHAVQRAGAVLVPINTRLTRREIDTVLACARPALVLHDARHAERAPAGSIEMERELDSVLPGSIAPRVPVDPDDVHSIVFTSGTTGTPKGAMLTHAAHRASADASALRLRTTADDRWLLCMPVFHVGGLSIVLRSAITGFAIVLEERFDVSRVNEAIQRRGVTTISVVPTMLDRMLEGAAGSPYPASLRCALTGGAPLRPALHARARAAGIPVTPTYGLTEACSQVATAEPPDVPGGASTGAEPGAGAAGRRRSGPTATLGATASDGATASVDVEPGVGRPLHGVDVRIADPDAAGLGEVLVRGPIVMRGYFEDEAATRAAIQHGWLRTGDLGRLDGSGRLSIEGRRSDLIITGGENVMPEEVESVLASHPDVADVAVLGVADDHWGQRVVAAVVPARGGVDEVALIAWCRDRLAGYKVPSAFVRIESLPRTASGKLLRRQVRLRPI